MRARTPAAGAAGRRLHLPISAPRLQVHAGAWTVSAEVDGRTVWFRSADLALQPRLEGFASAMLVPAMHHGMDLELDGEVCPRWAAGVRSIQEVFGRWWSYPRAEVRHRGEKLQAPRGPLTGLAFSCGVDSFFSLLRYPRPIDVILFLHGFEQSIRNSGRLAQFRAVLDRVAASTGRRAAVVETNLREHPLFAGTSFDRSHGGALAAAAHLLDGVGTLVISSSYPAQDSRPWGSHFETDHLWSGRELEVVHFGEHMWRREKLLDIVGEALVQENLRVCFENPDGAFNCGTCEKCVRTEIVLILAGLKDRFLSFQHSTPLASRIDGLRKNHHKAALVPVYKAFLGRGLDAETEAAIHRFVRRTRRLHHPLKEALRRVERSVRRRLRGGSRP